MDSVVKDSLIRLDKEEKGIDLLISEGTKNMNPDMVPLFADNIEKMMLAVEEEKQLSEDKRTMERNLKDLIETGEA